MSTFNPRNTEIYGELRHDLTVLQRDYHMKDVLKHNRFIKGKRQEKTNIRKKGLTIANFAEERKTKSNTLQPSELRTLIEERKLYI